MKKILFFAALVASLAPCHAQEEQPAAKPNAAEILAALRPSTVKVEIQPKYDHNNAPDYLLVELMKNNRPLELMGWIVAPDTVLTDDPGISARFTGAVSLVLPNGEKIAARPHALFARSSAMLLKTEAPVPGVAPIAFKPAGPPPQKGFVAWHDKVNTEWLLSLKKLDFADAAHAFNPRVGVVSWVNSNSLFINGDGAPAGFYVDGFFNPEKPFAVPPFADADLVLVDDLAAAEARLAALCGNGIHLATLNFRSPRQEAGQNRNRWSPGNDEDASMVQYAVALHLAPGRLLVLKACNARQTARLESVTVRDAAGNAVAAEFAASLENFGAFIADAPGLESAPLKVWPGDMRDLRGALVMLALVSTPGDQILMRHDRSRFDGFRESWRNLITASFNNPQGMALAFTPQGGLVTLPVARRGREGSSPPLENFSAAAFATLIANPPAAEIDAANVPLSERDENRAAWLGVELQPLTPQLAQEMKITRFTSQDNRRGSDEVNGGVVTHVHPGSPAERAGLKINDVLLRVHAEGRAQPHFINVSNEGYQREFPWAQYDSISLEYFERGYVPTPWPAANNAANQVLTGIGFGKAVRIGCVINGEPKDISLVVELSPDTYESAPQFEAEALGLNARDLTYEARHYFRRKPDDPGVIVSRVEAGRHAAVAGIRPYEIIVKVNDAEVRGIGEFEAALKDRQELQFTVRRMNRERIVRVNLAERVKAPEDAGDGED